MTVARDFFRGPWRAVPVLGVTEILSWGCIFYTPVLIVPLIAAERGWSIAFTMGGFSVGLLTAGLTAPYVGRSIDRYGGHVTMTIGSLIGALGLLLIVHADHPLAYYAVWMVLGWRWRRRCTMPPSERSAASSAPPRDGQSPR
jgi:MFS family permease